MITKVFKGEIEDTSNGLIKVLISTNKLDRDQEIIDITAWDKHLDLYKEHPILLDAHSGWGSVLNQIGEAKDVYTDKKGLHAIFDYYHDKGNPTADWAYYLAHDRKIAAYSVSFFPIPGSVIEGTEKDNFKRKYTENELLEVSQVLIPSLREAVQNDRKILQDEKGLLLCKSFIGEEKFQSELEEMAELKEGRMISTNNYKKLSSAISDIQNGLNTINDILEKATDSPKQVILEPDEKQKAYDLFIKMLKGGTL